MGRGRTLGLPACAARCCVACTLYARACACLRASLIQVKSFLPSWRSLLSCVLLHFFHLHKYAPLATLGWARFVFQSDGQFKKTACNDLLKKKNPGFKFTSMQDGLKAVSLPPLP